MNAPKASATYETALKNQRMRIATRYGYIFNHPQAQNFIANQLAPFLKGNEGLTTNITGFFFEADADKALLKINDLLHEELREPLTKENLAAIHQAISLDETVSPIACEVRRQDDIIAAHAEESDAAKAAIGEKIVPVRRNVRARSTALIPDPNPKPLEEKIADALALPLKHGGTEHQAMPIPGSWAANTSRDGSPSPQNDFLNSASHAPGHDR
ncbi:MAG: hypothetical protein V4735_07065 [Pseudomonadota bacterium]